MNAERRPEGRHPMAGRPLETVTQTGPELPRLTMEQARKIVALLKFGQVTK
jgi:hypothetical protein